MSNTTDRTMTAERLAALPDDGKRYELVDGVLQTMSPAGGEHGEVAGEAYLQIAQHVKAHRLGKTFAAETGFLIQQSPDTVLAPDVSYVSFERLGTFRKHRGYLPLAPDLVAEVISPHDRSREVESKTQAWLDAGVKVVLVVDPQASTIQVCRPAAAPKVHSDGFVDLNDVLPGFQLDVAELFAKMQKTPTRC